MKFGCCETCFNRDSVMCDDCEDADCYELDEDAVSDLANPNFIWLRQIAA